MPCPNSPPPCADGLCPTVLATPEGGGEKDAYNGSEIFVYIDAPTGGKKSASGGSCVTVEGCIGSVGCKNAANGSAASTAINVVANGKKTGWMQWPVVVLADLEGQGTKSVEGGDSVSVHAGMTFIKQPLGRTGIRIT
jgi:hypothetical protein